MFCPFLISHHQAKHVIKDKREALEMPYILKIENKKKVETCCFIKHLKTWLC
jgi:hypothetical protein